MSEDAIIERTLQAARDTYLSRALARLTDRVERLESEVRLLATLVEGKARPPRQAAGRTRPRVVNDA